MNRLHLLSLTAALLLASASAAAPSGKGKTIYDSTCAACHTGGIAGAPRFGNAADWAPRIKRGIDMLYQSALKGKPPAMPPRGGMAGASDGDIKAAVDYMVAAVRQGNGAQPAAAEAPKPNSAAALPKAPAKPPQPSQTKAQAVAEVNAFNRLLKPVGKRNLPPTEDGIHDPVNDGTQALQPPRDAFAPLPKANAGNRVNWVQALGGGHIAPRWDRLDPGAAPVVMDLNIVREVKGSMPDVVYPHKQHTEWLDCSNCHPQIFIPQKGANQISMAAILLGQKCGVCHGKVAFPVSECRNCHSKKKMPAPTASAAKK